MNKTLRVAVESAETGFDPQAISDLYSGFICRVIFDPLYQYDYLARPFKIIPSTAAGMPQISDDGKTWIIKVKPGIYFADDPAFKGKKRELTAADYVYSWKRLIDPKVHAPNIDVVTDRFVGDIEFGKAAAAGANVYDLDLEGMRALDRYTIQIKLKQPDYDLLDDLTTMPMSAVAREVVEQYGDLVAPGHVQSRGLRTLFAQGVATRAENHAGGEPDISRGVFSDQRRSRRQGHCRRHERQAHTGDRAHRDEHPRGIEFPRAGIREG